MSFSKLRETKRILVVEDRKDLRDMYVKNINRYIEKYNIHVDEVDSKAGAKELILRKTYHVVLLDIMLIEDKVDRGGIEVLDYIKHLNEGTLVVMLSGTDDINCAIHALRSRIVVDYIHKQEIKKPEIYIEPINSALDEVHIPIFGKYGGLSAYLAAPEKMDVSQWEFHAMQTVKSKGVDHLHKVLSKAFIPISPVLRKNNQLFSLQKDLKNNMLYGNFWSKATGSAVLVCINSNDNEKNGEQENFSGKLIYSETIKNLDISIRTIENTNRNEYVGDIWKH